MDFVSVDRPVTPRPSLLKTIGVLNVVFGLPLFFCGLACLRPVAPSFAQLETFRFEPEEFQNEYEQRRQVLIDALKAREQIAKSETNKQALKQLRTEFEKTRVKITDQVDQKLVDRGFRRMTWYLWADFVTGPMLNLLMLASGLGLIQLHGWARSLAIWTASLKIARLVILAFLLYFVVMPSVASSLEVMNATELWKVLVTQFQLDQTASHPDVAPVPVIEAKPFKSSYEVLGNVMTVFFLAISLIFPLISLFVLTRPSAAAACDEALDEEIDEESAARNLF